MKKRTAKDAMREFVSNVYMDKEVGEACVIEHWDRNEGTIGVRYASGSLQILAATFRPKVMYYIGKLRDSPLYDYMNKKQKELFKKKLNNLEKKVLKHQYGLNVIKK